MANAIETYALRLCELADAERISMRLFGSCAIRIQCGKNSEIFDLCKRYPKDIDCVIPKQDRNGLRELLSGNGWRENVELTAQMDGSRLEFHHSDPNLVLDVSVDVLRFSQTLDVRNRFSLAKPTLPAADLLLSKLQIKDLTPSDIIDTVVLLCSLALGENPARELEVNRVVDITANSWRWYKAVRSSFAAIEKALDGQVCDLTEANQVLVGSRLKLIGSQIADVPKTLTWKMRSLIGEILPWYDSVEPGKY